MTLASREKTAFLTPFGLYLFTMMPFRLHGAAATFQRLMNKILQPHNQYAATYIHNNLFYSISWEEHLWHLTNVLQALGDEALAANPAKCHVDQREVTYLGYTVGKGKLCPWVDNVQALETAKPPQPRDRYGSSSDWLAIIAASYPSGWCYLLGNPFHLVTDHVSPPVN